MKKMFAIVMALCLISSQAFAITYTVSSTEKFRDSQGNNKIRVQGTIDFDSVYPCNTTTGRCGEDLLPSHIGLDSISQIVIDPRVSSTAGGLLLFKYHPTGLSGSGGTSGNIRAYYAGANGSSNVGGFVSAPTYDLSALTSSPFMAVGA